MKYSLDRILISIFLIVSGIAVELVAFDIIPIDEKRVHAPNWIIALLGILFLAGGLTIFVNPKSGIARWAAGIVVITITIVSAWVSVFGASEHFAGDWPFLSNDTNVIIARIMFGCIALMGLAIIVAAAKKSWGQNDA